MISFSLVDVTLKCVSTGVRLTCSGRLCGGMYGDGGKCPCVTVAALPRYCLELRLAVRGNNDEKVDLRFQSYLSAELTEQLVGLDFLEVIMKDVRFIGVNNGLTMLEIWNNKICV
jgi:hypothetical protein